LNQQNPIEQVERTIAELGSQIDNAISAAAIEANCDVRAWIRRILTDTGPQADLARYAFGFPTRSQAKHLAAFLATESPLSTTVFTSIARRMYYIFRHLAFVADSGNLNPACSESVSLALKALRVYPRYPLPDFVQVLAVRRTGGQLPFTETLFDPDVFTFINAFQNHRKQLLGYGRSMTKNDLQETEEFLSEFLKRVLLRTRTPDDGASVPWAIATLFSVNPDSALTLLRNTLRKISRCLPPATNFAPLQFSRGLYSATHRSFCIIQLIHDALPGICQHQALERHQDNRNACASAACSQDP